MARQANQNGSSSRVMYWIVTTMFVSLLVLPYFLWPAYQLFIEEAWQTLASGDTEQIREWVSEYGAWGPAIVVLLMVLQMFLFVVPSWLLMVISVLAFGPVYGSLVAILAVAVASITGYGLGRLLGEQGLNRLLGPSKRQALTRETGQYGMWAVVIARLNPLLSNDGISLLGGMLQLGFFKFMAATLLGITPLTIAIAVFGEEWQSMKTGLVVLSIASLIGLGLKVWIDQRLRHM